MLRWFPRITPDEPMAWKLLPEGTSTRGEFTRGAIAMGQNSPMERAMRLAAVAGLKAALGPALVSAAQNRPERKALAMAAMGEMVIDKLPFVPSRSRLPLLLPRAFSGWWT